MCFFSCNGSKSLESPNNRILKMPLCVAENGWIKVCIIWGPTGAKLASIVVDRSCVEDPLAFRSSLISLKSLLIILFAQAASARLLFFFYGED